MPEGPEILYSSIVIKKLIKNYTFSTIDSFSDKQVKIPQNLKENLKNTKSGKVINIDCKGKVMWIEIENINQIQIKNDNKDNKDNKDKKDNKDNKDNKDKKDNKDNKKDNKDNKKDNKNIKLVKDSIFIHIHYGITGWLVDKEPEKYLKYKLCFKKDKKEKCLFMKDKRRFSKIQFLTREEHEIEINKLGPDIFTKEFSENKFKTLIKSKKKILASYLMDQKAMCGIGNYIKNDAMYLSKLNVAVKTSELKEEQIKELYKNILFVSYSKLMTHLSDSGITKNLPKNRKTNEPKKLEIPYEFKVYNQKETNNGKKVMKVTIGGRDSYSTEEYIPKTVKEKKRKSTNERGYQNKKITNSK